MDLFSKKIIKGLLQNQGFSPKKRLGQHFLIDRVASKKILKASDIQSGDVILEIGPGIGNLTQELARAARKVIAVEKDRKMIEVLERTTKDFKNIKIIQGDILKINPGDYDLKPGKYKIVANLPYYITSPVIRKFLESGNQPEEIVLMLQKEVAQRIVAKPPNMSLLTVSVQFYAKPEIITFISKKSFWPQPKVDSAIIRITNIHKNKRISQGKFFQIVRAGFSQPRKQIINNLAKGLKIDREKVKQWLLKNKIHPERRAETLELKEWLRLVGSFDFD
jgi:16S rRNA (adenine1518-N6/adenine1519-N6)-dimethyltransferase